MMETYLNRIKNLNKVKNEKEKTHSHFSNERILPEPMGHG